MARRKLIPPAKRQKTPRPAPAARRQPVSAAAAPGRIVYVLSDSTGNLARHMLTAFLTQFPRDAFSLRFKSFIQTDTNVNVAFQEIHASPGLVVHAVMSADLKEVINVRCRELKLPVCDLTGPFVEFLARESGISPDANYRR